MCSFLLQTRFHLATLIIDAIPAQNLRPFVAFSKEILKKQKHKKDIAYKFEAIIKNSNKIIEKIAKRREVRNKLSAC